MSLPSNVRIISYKRNSYRKFHIDENMTRFEISRAIDIDENYLKKIFQQLIDKAFALAKKDGKHTKYVYVTLMNPSLEIPIITGVWKADKDIAEILIQEINVLEISDKKVNFLSIPIDIYINTCNLPEGSGGFKGSQELVDSRISDLAQRDISPRSYIEIENPDNLCLFYALEIGVKLRFLNYLIKHYPYS